MTPEQLANARIWSAVACLAWALVYLSAVPWVLASIRYHERRVEASLPYRANPMAVPYIPPVTSSSQGTGEPAGCRWVLTTAPLIFVGLVSGIGILMTGSEVLHGRAGFIVWFLVWVAIFTLIYLLP